MFGECLSPFWKPAVEITWRPCHNVGRIASEPEGRINTWHRHGTFESGVKRTVRSSALSIHNVSVVHAVFTMLFSPYSFHHAVFTVQFSQCSFHHAVFKYSKRLNLSALIYQPFGTNACGLQIIPVGSASLTCHLLSGAAIIMCMMWPHHITFYNPYYE